MAMRDEIAVLLQQGVRPAEIARRLGVANATVGYHMRRLAVPSPPNGGSSTELGPEARDAVRTRERVRELLGDGLSRAEIARRLGLSKSTVSYHARRLGEHIDMRCARRYDWAIVQRYYDIGHSVSQCQARFGFSKGSWHDAVNRGLLVTRPAAMPIEEIFAADSDRSRGHLKLRLLREGLKEARCEACGIVEWLGQPLSLSLHHINGNRRDNRIENLSFLCPNCHSQTGNFAGRRQVG